MNYFEHFAGRQYQTDPRKHDVVEFVPVPKVEIETGIEVKEYDSVADYMREINRKPQDA